MPKLLSMEDWERFHDEAHSALQERQRTTATIYIGMGACGTAAGAGEIEIIIRAELTRQKVQAEVVPVGCIGMCFKEPLVDIQLPGQPRVTYANVKPDAVPRIIDEHLLQGKIVEKLALGQLSETGLEKIEAANLPEYSELPFYRKQIRVALRNCGTIDPESIANYIANQG